MNLLLAVLVGVPCAAFWLVALPAALLIVWDAIDYLRGVGAYRRPNAR